MNPDLALGLLLLTFIAEAVLWVRSWWNPSAGSVFC